ncbi:MAG: hypothetical protein K0R07_903 [Sedimentibacter sp.]|jgi:hypothetical protein|nr:hypothetical protein [Sedimentibacter sp.]
MNDETIDILVIPYGTILSGYPARQIAKIRILLSVNGQGEPSPLARWNYNCF